MRSAGAISITMTLGLVLLAASPIGAAEMSFEGLEAGTLLLTYTENGLTMDANPRPVYGPYVYSVGTHTGIHFDGGGLFFGMGGVAFDLTSISFDYVGAPDTRIFVTASGGFTATLPTTIAYSTYYFDTFPEFHSITSFTLTPEEQYPCVEIDRVEFVPEPAAMSLLALGGLALIRRRT